MTQDQLADLWGLGPYLAILLIAALPTHIWRWMGVLFAGRINEESEVFIWVKFVATALLGALIAKLILLSSGPLATLPQSVRIGAVGIGLVAYMLAGRRLVVGILVAELALIAGWFTLR